VVLGQVEMYNYQKAKLNAYVTSREKFS